MQNSFGADKISHRIKQAQGAIIDARLITAAARPHRDITIDKSDSREHNRFSNDNLQSSLEHRPRCHVKQERQARLLWYSQSQCAIYIASHLHQPTQSRL